MMINYLSVNVYKCPMGDCTNNGVSSRHKKIALRCVDGPFSFESDAGVPDNFCYVKKFRPFGDRAIYKIVPADVVDGKIVDRGGKWYMMGGNFAYSSDSRFSEMIGGMYGAVPIHDRVE